MINLYELHIYKTWSIKYLPARHKFISPPQVSAGVLPWTCCDTACLRDGNKLPTLSPEVRIILCFERKLIKAHEGACHQEVTQDATR